MTDDAFEPLMQLGASPATARQKREIKKLTDELNQRHPIVKQVITSADGRIQILPPAGRGFKAALQKRFTVAHVGRIGTDEF